MTEVSEVSEKELRDFWDVYREFDEGGPDTIASLIIASRRVYKFSEVRTV